MKQEVKIGQTDYTVLVLIRDTAGAPKTGLTNASAGIDVCYTRVETDNDVVLTAGAPVALVTPALTDPHLDWGFLEVDATNAPGLYRLDIADGVFATGAWSAVVSLVATGIDPCQIEFVLVAFDPRDSVRLGLTALPNAAADAAGGLPISDAGGLDMDDIPTTAEFNARSLPSADYTIVTDLGVVQTADHTAGIADIPTVAEFNARSLPSADYTVVTDLGTVQTADHTAAIVDIPTVAEFNARSLPSADYTVVTDLGVVQTADHTASIAAIKAITDLLPSGIKKNTALTNFEFYMVLAADHISPATGKTIVCQRSIDGGAFANCNTVNATEVSAGVYKLDLAASDLNGNVITFKFTEALCDTRMVTIKTST